VTERLDLGKCGRHPVSKGGFGDVHQGVLVGGEKVAIKSARLYFQQDEAGRKALRVSGFLQCFVIDLIDTRNNQDVAHELYVWSSLKHANIVELIGLARFQDQLSMVSPWMENGPLPGYISRHPEVDRIQLVSNCSKNIYALIHKCVYTVLPNICWVGIPAREGNSTFHLVHQTMFCVSIYVAESRYMGMLRV
jgi:hypothetical protein